MSIENMIFNGLSESLSKDRKQGLVLELAEKLGVGDQIITREEATSIARAEAQRVTREQAATTICDGETVNTEYGQARAVVLDSDGRRALQQVLEALNG